MRDHRPTARNGARPGAPDRPAEAGKSQERRSPDLLDVLQPRERVSRAPDPPPPERPPRGPGIRGGIAAGVVAGAVASACVMVASVARGTAIWIPPKLASAPFFGERSLMPQFDPAPVLVGVAAHFGVCAAWGALFGAIFYGSTRGATIAFGALWGLVVWLAMHYGVLPLLGIANVAAIVPAGVALGCHLLFGLTLALSFLPFQRVRRPLESTL